MPSRRACAATLAVSSTVHIAAVPEHPRVPPRRKARRVGPVACAVALSLLATACGRSNDGDADASARTDAPKVPAVVIDTFMFRPKALRVDIGDTVTWTSHDDILHTVTSGTRDYEPGNGGEVTATHKDGMFDMQLDGKGATARFTFTQAGTFHYFCDRHPGMEADVDVS